MQILLIKRAILKKITFSSLIILSSINLFAQVGGLSASKLGTLCTTTVAQGNIEFEPFLGFSVSSNQFDDLGKVQNLFSTSDSTLMFSSMGFRFSYGLIKNLEIGISLPIDISEINFAAKYKLPFEGKLTAGLLAGYSSIIGNQVYVRRNAAHEVMPSFIGGLILSYEMTDKLSIDFDAQYQQHTLVNTQGHTKGFYVNSDIGYYLLEKINFIVGLNYNYQAYENSDNNSHLLALNTGLAIERAKHFILVLNAPFDILGKNEYQTRGFGMALTILLD